jgi:acetaldehyde dehydrogenase/alcohol dehydrogenase
MQSVDMILATGGPGMVKSAYSSGKPALGVGAGNTPAIIDDTADITLAVNSIIHSKTFDNGMICASEQSVIVLDKVYELSPLSYVIVNYKGEVEIYDKKSDKYEMIELCEKDVIGTMGDYIINLSTDSVSIGDNSRLLIKSVDSLELYKSGK